MENKIVAKIKGSTWSSISFVVKDEAQLGKLFQVLKEMNVVESAGFTLPDGYKSIYYEDVPISLSIESCVQIHTKEEMDAMRKLEEKHAVFLEQQAKEQEPEGAADDTPVD